MRKPFSLEFRPALETLTDRTMPSVSLLNGDIVITGRDDTSTTTTFRSFADDRVFIDRYSGPVMTDGRTADVYRVNDNGSIKDFPVSQVTGKIIFNGHGGNDLFENRAYLPVKANGGAGNDTLIGGAADDVLDGGSGQDLVYGLAGGDILTGGFGDDQLYGGTGNDQLNGGLGFDQLSGDAGNDFLMYSADSTWDYVHISSGGVPLGGRARSFDRFLGGDGVDQLLMTNGNDALLLDDTSVSSIDRRRFDQVELIQGSGGNDIIDLRGPVNSLDTLLAGVYVDGGAGDDSIVGSQRFRTTLYGGGSPGDSAWVHANMSNLSGFATVQITNVPTDQPQTDSWSCGPNSVSRYLRAYGIDASYAETRAYAQERGIIPDYGLGTTPGTLLQVMQHWKTDSQRVEETNTARMISLLQQGKPVVALVSMERTPVIVSGFTVGHYGKLHYVVMTGYNATTDKFSYTDTNGAQKAWSRNEFEDKWNWHGHFTGAAGQSAQASLWTMGLRNNTLFY